MPDRNIDTAGPAEGAGRFVPLLLASIAVPILTFLAVAWLDYRAILHAARKDAADVAEIACQQAGIMLHTQELVGKNVSQHIAGMSWDEIGGSPSLHEYLKDLGRTYPQVEAVWLADPSGRLRNSSRAFPMPDVSVADRDYFTALRDHDTGTFIGRMVRGRLDNLLNFNVVRRRETSSGAFDGVVIVSAWQSHIARFWRAISPDPASSTALVRGDGMVLARQPELRGEASQLAGVSLVRRAAQADTEHPSFRAVSPFDGVERFFVARRIGAYDVYLVHGVAVSSTLAKWYGDLWTFGGFFAIATIALTATALAALQQARRERHATVQWRAAAQRADEELARRKAVEEQLLQSQKLEMLGQMAGSVAHDFGNILMVIVSSLERLQGRQREPKLEQRVQVASAAADKGAKAIRSLLAFARRQPLLQETCNPNNAIEDMQPLLRQSLDNRCKLVLDLAAGVRPVTVDRNQFEMAMLNLAVNARDAMPGGGTLCITTANRRLSGIPAGLAGDFVMIEIADTGTGMPPDIAARVFEPFFTTKPPGVGTGLGLSQVYGFARQSGGAATVHSEIDVGTTITLYLPSAGEAWPTPDNETAGRENAVPGVG